ncbi:hypothetical protein C366_02575 [Cryptococcus neoformans Tu401-1]|nr:hypothetical protein C366_02575 [Cryptococcus neoformans var. grubii Tu401-1]OXM79833.1 hypothetical protein C364_02538 [Cryptococcus neoformans var. grubii Bt63]
MPYSLRPRTHSPLAELPLDRYLPARRLSASPTPRGSKRHQLGASSGQPVASSSKNHCPMHLRGTEDGDGMKSPIRKRTRTVTPRVKQVLDRDDLGVGKSPARRLFAAPIAESSSHPSLGGISGAILTPSSNDIRATQNQTPIQNQYQHDEDGSGNGENIHDPGFVIHLDPEGLVVGRPHTRSRSRSTSPFPSSTLSELDIDNQENIPPPTLLPSTSTCSASIPGTPHSTSGGSTSTSSRVDSYLCISPSTVSPSSHHSHHHWSPYSRSGGTHGSHGHTPGSRKREQSKLVNELLLLRGEDVPASTKTQIKTRTRTESDSRHRTRKMEEAVIIPDELTPGRRTTRGMARRGKDLLAQEVDSV